MVVGSRGDDLPGTVFDESVEALGVHALGHRAHGAVLAGPAEGAGEAAVQDHQQVPAWQGVQGGLQLGHGDEGRQVIGHRVARDDVAGRTVVAIGRNAVAGEVEDDAVVRANGLLHRHAQQLAQLRAGGAGVNQRGMNLKAVLARWRCQQLGQAPRIVGGGAQGRNAIGVGIDADDEGVVGAKAAPACVGFGHTVLL